MKALAKLKDEARKHEQKEEWEKAIHAYVQVLKTTENGEGEVDLPLYNRVGDLYVRLGKPADAVTFYEKAADQYAEAGLYNNAIALCNKAMRYLPNRLELLRKLGQFSAAQGFLVDARRWYLEYAERQIKAGQLDDAFGALEHFASVNEDAEVRELLGRQYKAYARDEQALGALKRAYELRQQAGETALAEKLKKEILAMNPSALDTSPDQPATASEPAASWHAETKPDLPGFGDIGIETAAGAAFGAEPLVSPAEHGNIDLGMETLAIESNAPESAPGLDMGLIEIDTASHSDAEVTTNEFATLDSDLMGLGEDLPTFDDDAGGDLPMLDTGTDDRPMFETESHELEDLGGDLPLEQFHTDEEEDEPLPLMDLGGDAAAVSADELPSLGTEPTWLSEFVEEEQQQPIAEPERVIAEAEPEPLPDFAAMRARAKKLIKKGDAAAAMQQLEEMHPLLATAGQHREAWDVVDQMLGLDPDNVHLLQQRVEYASHLGDRETLLRSYLELARQLANTGSEAKAKSAFQLVLDVDPNNEEARAALQPAQDAPPPAATSGGYVDLFALISEEDQDDKSSRFVVAEKPPTGDEDRDFADMLSQFKQKVSENISVDDAAAHYDLGLAFKEMGLIDEAIAEFQTSMKGGEERLKVYEELGQCFLLKQQYNVAVTVLTRALRLPVANEEDLIGVYYALARSHEELGQRAEAKQAYERVIGLDIGFQDASQRLAQL